MSCVLYSLQLQTYNVCLHHIGIVYCMSILCNILCAHI
uniref:Uncharacterized protein n=1 Tax=Anguilla anguilla TaxID=7936 RepID=A0A0E9XPU2_ANGAN